MTCFVGGLSASNQFNEKLSLAVSPSSFQPNTLAKIYSSHFSLGSLLVILSW